MRPLAFITGASEGLGRCFAKQFAKLNYQTICVARNEARLKQLVHELGDEHNYLVADLSTTAGLQSCIRFMQENRVNALVNNAGFSEFGLFREADMNNQLAIFHVNCQSTLQLAHAFLQQAEKGDALINLSSITHWLITPTQPVYCASKSFIASLSESLWFQERARGVYVQGLLPGISKTQFIKRASGLDGFKLAFLDSISQSPEAVVRSSITALQKQKGPIVVPGIHNRLLMLLLRLTPRKWLVWLMGHTGNLAD